jgi:hypothetical protein
MPRSRERESRLTRRSREHVIAAGLDRGGAAFMSSAQERATGYQQGNQGETQASGPAGQNQPGMQAGTEAGRTGSRTETGTPGRAAEARPATADRDYGSYDSSPAATGGMMLAGTLLVLAGLWEFFVGITGVLKGAFFTPVTTYSFDYSLYSWGWTHLGIGIGVFAVGVCLLLGMAWARYLGVFVASVSAIANFLFLPHYPLWSIIVIAIDLFIIWALLNAGRRQPA